ncbi:MAG: sulfotransferase [Pseudomonadota bacterium]
MVDPIQARELRAAARARLCALRRAQPAPVADLCAQVREVVVLCSSSRGGSSVMAEILRSSGQMLHFRAEINPFLVLSGHGWPDSGRDDDRLGTADLRGAPLLDHLIAHDVGRPCASLPDEAAVERFALEIHWRLCLQWPLERFDAGWVLEAVRATLADLERDQGWLPGAFPEPPRFHACLLARVAARHPAVNPWYYDLPPALIREHCPASEPSAAPPSPVLLEEPPFVTVVPWRAPSAEDLACCPLIIKTPSNVYRLGFLARLFPKARLRVLHLTRNAAASVNGLVDGWRFRGFFAHSMPGKLAMAGYSDEFPAWGADWWKFDLPPGWRAWAHEPLVEVCGHQWRSAHEAVLDWVRDHPVDVLRLPFERVVGTHSERTSSFEELQRWLGLPVDPSLQRLVEAGLPPIMATSRPRHRRWYEKASLLEPVLAREDTRAVMEALGYAHDPRTWI